MEINEAGRRIVGQHWSLILLFLVVGAVAAFVLVGGSQTYTASARLVLNTPDPTDRAAAIAIADTGNALATSPAEVTRALRSAHVTGRSGITVAKHVSVRGLGTSGVLQLSVTDKSPSVAAAVANALAARVIQTRRDLSSGELQRALARLNEQIETLNRRIVNVEAAAAARRAGPTRDAATRLSDSLTQQRSVLESARVGLLSADAQRPEPKVISGAVVPEQADSSPRLPDTILGALLGLVVGLGLAGLIETVRPSIVGSNALAAEFDTPLLGTLSSGVSNDHADHELARIAARLRLSSESAGVESVALVANSPAPELERLAERLGQVQRPAAEPVADDLQGGAGRARSQPRIMVFGEGRTAGNGTAGLVLVLPRSVKKSEVVDIEHLLRVTPFALLGLITYRPSRLRARAAVGGRGVRFRILTAGRPAGRRGATISRRRRAR